MCTPWVRIVVHENKIECLWQFRNDCMLCILPEVARSEVGYRITEFTQKFICVLLAVSTSDKTPDAGSTWIAVMIIGHLVKALWNFD